MTRTFFLKYIDSYRPSVAGRDWFIESRALTTQSLETFHTEQAYLTKSTDLDPLAKQNEEPSWITWMSATLKRNSPASLSHDPMCNTI